MAINSRKERVEKFNRRGNARNVGLQGFRTTEDTTSKNCLRPIYETIQDINRNRTTTIAVLVLI